ncbi:hypothetical protein E4U59_004221 [Claviceps monticola]|nr:hypothetical protein E4U59_004221 [Claviceps monticola]
MYFRAAFPSLSAKSPPLPTHQSKTTNSILDIQIPDVQRPAPASPTSLRLDPKGSPHPRQGNMAARRTQFHQEVLIDTTPLPDSIPAVKEVGTSSAPLLSASYFIGARCRDYNDDYMQCKNENAGRGEFDCMKEGRRVTRCAQSVLKDIDTHCLAEFRKHWDCLENRNHQMWQCRPDEWKLNKCVYDKLNLEKKIPDQPPNVTPVHLRTHQIFADRRIGPGDGKPFVAAQSEAKQ